VSLRTAAALLDAECMPHPCYVCYGFDRAETSILIYTRGPMPVPESYGGYPVSVVAIESVRFTE